MDSTRPTTGNFFIRHATAIAIGSVTLLMLLAALSFWQQEETSVEAKGWLVHTYEVMAHIESLLSKLQDAETGERAYLLTGNESYLAPYEEALREASAQSEMASLKQQAALGPGVADTSLRQHRSIAQELAYIRHLTADNPVEQSNLDEMDEVVRKQ